MKYIFKTPLILFLLFSTALPAQAPFTIVLGVAQDGGYPHLGCEKTCCSLAWQNDSMKRFVTSLALVDPATKKWWLFEATPDIKAQLQYFKNLTKGGYNYLPAGIFITHAHIGHYTGLAQLGREVSNTKEIPVFVLPKMKKFLETNGPWSQLVNLKNIALTLLDTIRPMVIGKDLSVQTFTVPHRDEFSETAGFKINTTGKKYLFIPDIDKWQKWTKNIVNEVEKVDIAFVDGTFSSIDELRNRKIEEVPHPFIPETMKIFENENTNLKGRVHFIHFNHTNELLWDRESVHKTEARDFKIAEQGKVY